MAFENGLKPKNRRGPAKAGPGRPPGLQNKVSLSVKAALIAAFEQRGGVASLVAWAEKDPGAFYQLWGRLAPREIVADVSVTLSPEERLRRVAEILTVGK